MEDTGNVADRANCRNTIVKNRKVVNTKVTLYIALKFDAVTGSRSSYQDRSPCFCVGTIGKERLMNRSFANQVDTTLEHQTRCADVCALWD